MKSFLEEFKSFAMRGNVVELAIAVVIGGAFGKIVSSLVDSILIPFVGLLLGGIDFTGWNLTIGQASIAYGRFIQSCVDFLIIAFVIFVVVKVMQRMKDAHEKKAIPVEPSEEIKILREIRDELKKK